MLVREDLKVGGIYYTAGGMPCEVQAIAGRKVVFKMTLQDGTVRQLDSGVGRFLLIVSATNPRP